MSISGWDRGGGPHASQGARTRPQGRGLRRRSPGGGRAAARVRGVPSRGMPADPRRPAGSPAGESGAPDGALTRDPSASPARPDRGPGSEPVRPHPDAASSGGPGARDRSPATPPKARRRPRVRAPAGRARERARDRRFTAAQRELLERFLDLGERGTFSPGLRSRRSAHIPEPARPSTRGSGTRIGAAPRSLAAARSRSAAGAPAADRHSTPIARDRPPGLPPTRARSLGVCRRSPSRRPARQALGHRPLRSGGRGARAARRDGGGVLGARRAPTPRGHGAARAEPNLCSAHRRRRAPDVPRRARWFHLRGLRPDASRGSTRSPVRERVPGRRRRALRAARGGASGALGPRAARCPRKRWWRW